MIEKLSSDDTFAKIIIGGLLREVHLSDKLSLSIIDIANIIALSSCVYLLLIILLKGKTTKNNKHENALWFLISIPAVSNPVLSFAGLVTFLYPNSGETSYNYIIFIIVIINIIYFYILCTFLLWRYFLRSRSKNIFFWIIIITWVIIFIINIASSAFALYNLFGSHELGLLRIGLVTIATTISCGSVLGVSYLLRPNGAVTK